MFHTRRALVAVVIVAGALVLSAAPASAHLTQAPVLNDANQRMGFAEVGADHRTLAACDTRADGIGVYGRFELTNGQTIDIAGSKGSASDCGRGSIPSGATVRRYIAIARDGHTSGWTTP